MMTFDEAVDYLSSLSHLGIKPGLARIQALCEAFDHPERKFRSVHVGGTNGKGSTCAMIAEVLHEAGHRTGLYLSPYVNTVRERVQVNGGMIPESEFARLVTRIAPVADALSERSDIGRPTEFEVKTVLGFLYFVQQECEFVVSEVGLGGAYDATNVLFPEVTVITNVTLDHTEYLGTTVAQIAGEKAGIIKIHTPCVTGAVGDAQRVIAGRCHEAEASLWRLGEEIVTAPGQNGMDVTVGRHRYTGIAPSMAGDHQRGNAALAVGAIDQLIRAQVPITDSAIRDGIRKAVLPGRFERVRSSPDVVLDGAHNPAKAAALAEALRKEYPGRSVTFVYGAAQGHDFRASLEELLPLAARVYVTEPSFRAVPAGEIVAHLESRALDVHLQPNVPAAVEQAIRDAGPEDLICVTGSLYVVGEAGVAARSAAG